MSAPEGAVGPAAQPPPGDPAAGSPPPRQPRNPIGRRAWDKGKTVSIFVLVIGALFQGGFLLVVRDLNAKDERQQNAERTVRSEQHRDMMTLYEATSDQLDAVTAVLQAKAGQDKERPATFRARRAAVKSPPELPTRRVKPTPIPEPRQ